MTFASFLSLLGAWGSPARVASSLLSAASEPLPLTPRWWLPTGDSTFAHEVDRAFALIYWLDVVFFILIVGAMTVFAVAYRRKKAGQRTSALKGHHGLEIVWSVIPGLFLLVFFAMGFLTYMDMQVPPASSMQVRVTGQKWNWGFEYPEQGIKLSSADGLVVPSNTPIQLTLTSVDVLHSFYIPNFRTKKDAVPQRFTSLWFEAKQPGTYQVYCTEYCGDDHSRMTSKVVAMEPAAFREWVADQKNASASLSPVERGQRLFTTQGCAGCHSIDGSALVGPSLKGKYGTQEKLSDGSQVLVDDNYVRESILAPNAKIVAGFAGQMPPYVGRLQDDEISALIDYIKTIK